MIDQDKLGDSVLEIRKLKGMSQLELSEASGVSRYKISCLENHKQIEVTESDLHGLARAFGLPKDCMECLAGPNCDSIRELIMTSIRAENGNAKKSC